MVTAEVCDGHEPPRSTSYGARLMERCRKAHPWWAPRCEYWCSQLVILLFFHMLSIVFIASTHVVMVAIKIPAQNAAQIALNPLESRNQAFGLSP